MRSVLNHEWTNDTNKRLDDLIKNIRAIRPFVINMLRPAQETRDIRGARQHPGSTNLHATVIDLVLYTVWLVVKTEFR